MKIVFLKRNSFSKKGDFVIEKTPAYFPDPKVPERINKHFPKTKLILVVREPVDRIISRKL